MIYLRPKRKKEKRKNLSKAELPYNTLLNGVWLTDGKRRWPLHSREKVQKATLIDFNIIWDSEKFGWAYSLESLEEAEPDQAKVVFDPHLMLRSKHLTAFPTQVTIRQSPVIFIASKWQPLLETGVLWHYTNSKSALKLPTCPLHLSKKDLCPLSSKGMLIPLTAQLAYAWLWDEERATEGENHVSTVWSWHQECGYCQSQH